MLPVTEIERANVIFEAIGFKPEKGAEASEPAQDMGKKKDSPSRSSSKSSRDKSTSQNNSSSRTSEKPSVTAKLEAFDKAIKQQDVKAQSPHQGVKAGSIMPAARLAIMPTGAVFFAHEH
jgi:hypothetical protein